MGKPARMWAVIGKTAKGEIVYHWTIRATQKAARAAYVYDAEVGGQSDPNLAEIRLRRGILTKSLRIGRVSVLIDEARDEQEGR